jgi:hypothetical protein
MGAVLHKPAGDEGSRGANARSRAMTIFILDVEEESGANVVLPQKISHVFLNRRTSEEDCHEFFFSLLRSEISGRPISGELRRAILHELGSSPREEKNFLTEMYTQWLRKTINYRKWEMHENGERPRGGIHEAAVAEVAKREGMTVAALKKRIARRQK